MRYRYTISEKTMGVIETMANFNDVLNMYQRFRANPMQMLNQKFSIPQNINNPNEIIQHLVDTGQVSQNQVDQVKNNPIIQQLMRY